MIKNDQTMGEGYESLMSLVTRDIIAERVKILETEKPSTKELYELLACWQADDRDQELTDMQCVGYDKITRSR